VEDAQGTVTEYAHDLPGNLIRVIAAKGTIEQNSAKMTYDSLGRKRDMTDPDMGYWTYEYDKSGNLIAQTDARKQTITFAYDTLNRLTEKVYPPIRSFSLMMTLLFPTPWGKSPGYPIPRGVRSRKIACWNMT